MTPRTKTHKTATPQSPKKGGKQKGQRRAEPPPDLPPPVLEASSAAEDEEPSLNSVMNILVDISVRLATNKENVETLAVHTDAQNHTTAVAALTTS